MVKYSEWARRNIGPRIEGATVIDLVEGIHTGHPGAPFPHVHGEVLRMYESQVIECDECGFMVPPGYRCPQCGRRR